MAETETVLVTGASGFIALHCIVQLLQAGYRVRGSLRTPGRAEEVRETVARQTEPGDRLDFVTAELTEDAGWDDAVAGCRYVLHVASPLSAVMPADENEMIVPARDGAKRVLAAAARAGVKRVVLTSSVAAVAAGHYRESDYVFDETDWTDLDGANVSAYDKSKTLAERAAWDFIAGNEAGEMELAVINPGLVLGPILNGDYGTSLEVVRRLMQAKPPALPRIGFSVVDVRDVAAAHLLAMTDAAAAGERFCCVNGYAWFEDLARVLHDPMRARGYKIPRRRMPDFVVRLVGLFDPAVRGVSRNLSRARVISSDKLRQRLNWQPRDLEEMTLAAAESLIDHDAVR